MALVLDTGALPALLDVRMCSTREFPLYRARLLLLGVGTRAQVGKTTIIPFLHAYRRPCHLLL